ncbi:UNVERIFIED_CONTAM: hypothetical protein Slati_0447300 [Sesamum latifolium]|uniref:Uncharacterized protein n=1 Tax=Sesamum latifolium TaxID=2727402 RepID=A0AAW2Y081_9LAMI
MAHLFGRTRRSCPDDPARPGSVCQASRLRTVTATGNSSHAPTQLEDLSNAVWHSTIGFVSNSYGQISGTHHWRRLWEHLSFGMICRTPTMEVITIPMRETLPSLQQLVLLFCMQILLQWLRILLIQIRPQKTTTAPTLDQTVGPAAMSPLFCEQFRETINSTLLGSQASGAGPSSQLERGETPISQDIDEKIYAELQQHRSIPADFVSKEAAPLQPSKILQSLRKEMVELRHQVTKETTSAERGIPFTEHIVMEELPGHFRAPSHLPAYDGNTNPAKNICKFENAALLYSYTNGKRFSR